MPSPLRSLPVLRWASRFDGGSVVLSGRLVAPFRWCEDGDAAFELPTGPIRVELVFVGGQTPRVPEVRLQSEDLVLVLVDGQVHGQGPEPVPATRPMDAIQALVDELHDPSVRVEARPSEDLWVKLAPGLSASLPAGGTITVEAAAIGAPDHPRLRRSLVVSVGGAGLSIRLPGSRWLAVLASVAIRSASLAPDGGVELHGHASGRLNGAVGVGLRQASHHLSDLVRKSPQFARVRKFLDTSPAQPRATGLRKPTDG
jgi:hypothetical protein